MIIVFFDTEFNNFADLGLISIGCISEDGEHNFYGERNDYKIKDCSNFVKEIVIPLLNPEISTDFNTLKSNFESWIESLPDDEILFLSDYQGDIKIFWKYFNFWKSKKKIKTQLIQNYLEYKMKQSSYSHNEIMNTLQDLMKNMETELDKDISQRHHSLYDTKANRKVWIELTKELNL